MCLGRRSYQSYFISRIFQSSDKQNFEPEQVTTHETAVFNSTSFVCVKLIRWITGSPPKNGIEEQFDDVN